MVWRSRSTSRRSGCNKAYALPIVWTVLFDFRGGPDPFRALTRRLDLSRLRLCAHLTRSALTVYIFPILLVVLGFFARAWNLVYREAEECFSNIRLDS